MSKTFISDSFLLHNGFARSLYHEYVREMPVYDYHSHLPAEYIAENRRFETITEAWLYHDHYKWRAMRANGIEERLITGSEPSGAGKCGKYIRSLQRKVTHR
jgi:glucuronate isomerase